MDTQQTTSTGSAKADCSPKFHVWDEAWMMWKDRPLKVLIQAIHQEGYIDGRIKRTRKVIISYQISDAEHGFTTCPRKAYAPHLYKTREQLIESL